MKDQIDISDLKAGMHFELGGYTYTVHTAEPITNDEGEKYMYVQFYLDGLQPVHENIQVMVLRFGRSFELS